VKALLLPFDEFMYVIYWSLFACLVVSYEVDVLANFEVDRFGGKNRFHPSENS
jgi:hypothetical protein